MNTDQPLHTFKSQNTSFHVIARLLLFIITYYMKYKILHENKQTKKPAIARANKPKNVVQLVAR